MTNSLHPLTAERQLIRPDKRVNRIALPQGQGHHSPKHDRCETAEKLPLEIRPAVRPHDDEIDLAILRTHGQTDFGRYVMGGVSAKLVWTSTVPVIWVREPSPEVVPDS
jgi:nucleotide-binding universal stress UspA family protein